MNNGHLFKRNGVFYLRRVVNGKRVTSSLGVTTKPEADRERKALLAADKLAAHNSGSAAVPAVKLTDSWAAFVSSARRKQCTDSTLGVYKAQWKGLVDWLPAKCLTLDDITHRMASDYLLILRHLIGPNTWNKHLTLLRYVWRVLHSDTGGMVTVQDPFYGIPAMTVPLNRHEAFTTEQIQAMYGAAVGEMRDIIAVAAYTGLRRVDCVTLKLLDYDNDTGTISVVPEKTKRTGAAAVIAAADIVREVFERRMQMPTDSQYVFPDSASVYLACPQTWGMRFSRFMEKTLQMNGDKRLYGMHSLRHWFRSSLTDAGVPEAVINSMMSHATGSVTMRYVHPSLDALRKAVATLPDIRQ